MVPPICANPTCKHPRQRTKAAVNHMVNGLCNTCYKQHTKDSTTKPAEISMNDPLNDEERQQWVKLTHRQLRYEQDRYTGVLQVPPLSGRGKGKRLREEPVTQIGSSTAADRTVRQRSEKVEQIIDSISSKPGSSAAVVHANQVVQLASLIHRRPALYSEAAKVAGLNIHGKLTVEAMIQLKSNSGLPHTMIRFIRSFLQANNLDIFASEPKMRNKIKEIGLPEYSYGTI